MKKMIWYHSTTKKSRKNFTRNVSRLYGGSPFMGLFLFILFYWMTKEIVYYYLPWDIFFWGSCTFILADTLLWLKGDRIRAKVNLKMYNKFKNAMFIVIFIIHFAMFDTLFGFRLETYTIVPVVLGFINLWAASRYNYNKNEAISASQQQHKAKDTLESAIQKQFFFDINKRKNLVDNKLALDYSDYLSSLKNDTSFPVKRYKNSEFSDKARRFMALLDTATEHMPEDIKYRSYALKSKYELMASLVKGYKGEEKTKEVFRSSGTMFSSGDNFLIPKSDLSEKAQILEVDFMVIGDGAVYLFENKDFSADKIVLEASGYFYKVDKYGKEHKLETLNQANRQRNLLRSMLGDDIEIINFIVLSDSETKIINNFNLSSIKVVHIDGLAFYLSEIKQKNAEFSSKAKNILEPFRKEESAFEFFDIDAELDCLMGLIKEKSKEIDEAGAMAEELKLILESPTKHLKSAYFFNKPTEFVLSSAEDVAVNAAVEVVENKQYVIEDMWKVHQHLTKVEEKLPRLSNQLFALLEGTTQQA